MVDVVDGIIEKEFSEILYSLPYMLVVILLLVVLEPSLTTIIIALTITGWISMSRHCAWWGNYANGKTETLFLLQGPWEQAQDVNCSVICCPMQ